ncbi:YceI family protein [Hydrogenovibrio sp. 3SP14C1]|uniref:YceI family protein n=1 Tax=Hydrogenovibrio sp. 3SP14C1 TaxID=3038774 RepID=UPI00241603EB|nr:YceI family protein [Hydrogenovibrio sp. 3SP14C1]MDG4813133.1 YceI family protein [Hydrogenovibrio sp. 3SP14C1]
MKPFNRLSPFILAAGLMLFSSLGWSAPVKYQIDTKGMHASINFKIQHLGYSWLTGRFDKFDGNFTYDKEKVSNSQVNVTIDTKSVNTNHAERDKHLRSDDFLDVNKFPTATFVSSSIKKTADNTLNIKGNLTLHGVTKAIEIQAQKIGEGKDPWGGYRAGFSGTTLIKLADYGITYNLGPASANVYFQLNLEGVRQ